MRWAMRLAVGVVALVLTVLLSPAGSATTQARTGESVLVGGDRVVGEARGYVFLDGRLPLPPGASTMVVPGLEFRLEEVSESGVAAPVVGSWSFTDVRLDPSAGIGFMLIVDEARIDSSRAYTLSVRGWNWARHLILNTDLHPVITQNAPTRALSLSLAWVGNQVATIQTSSGSTYRVRLVSQENIRDAWRNFYGDATVNHIPIGTVVRGSSEVNTGWDWHIDPASFEFAFATIEVCDGQPFDVENGTVTSDLYCPWISKIISITPPGPADSAA